MEKRNIIKEGRTPDCTEKTAEAVDAGVNAFEKSAKDKGIVKVKGAVKDNGTVKVTVIGSESKENEDDGRSD